MFTEILNGSARAENLFSLEQILDWDELLASGSLSHTLYYHRVAFFPMFIFGFRSCYLSHNRLSGELMTIEIMK